MSGETKGGILYSFIDDAEELRHADSRECILDRLQSIPVRHWPERMTAFAYVQRELDVDDVNPALILDDVLERIHADWGDPYDGPLETEAMRTAAKEFAEVIVEEFHVYWHDRDKALDIAYDVPMLVRGQFSTWYPDVDDDDLRRRYDSQWRVNSRADVTAWLEKHPEDRR